MWLRQSTSVNGARVCAQKRSPADRLARNAAEERSERERRVSRIACRGPSVRGTTGGCSLHESRFAACLCGLDDP